MYPMVANTTCPTALKSRNANAHVRPEMMKFTSGRKGVRAVQQHSKGTR